MLIVILALLALWFGYNWGIRDGVRVKEADVEFYQERAQHWQVKYLMLLYPPEDDPDDDDDEQPEPEKVAEPVVEVRAIAKAAGVGQR